MPGSSSITASRRSDGASHTALFAPTQRPFTTVHCHLTTRGRDTCRYFVAVAHIYHFLRRSEVLLYVNGQLVEQQYLIYPKIDVPATSSSASFFVFFIRVLCP